MAKEIRIVPESELDKETLEEIKLQEFSGKKRASISKASVVISVLLSLFFTVIIAGFSAGFYLLYNSSYLYEQLTVSSSIINPVSIEFENINITMESVSIDGLTSKEYESDYCQINSDIYIPNPLDKNRIYKVNRNSGKSEKLCEIPAQYLNLVDNKIYFANNYSNTEYEQGIYELDVESLEYRKLCSKTVEDLTVKNGWFYYIDLSNRNIYMRNVNSGIEELVIPEKCKFMKKYRNTIYFSTEGGIIKCISNDNKYSSLVNKVYAYDGLYTMQFNDVYSYVNIGNGGIRKQSITENENIKDWHYNFEDGKYYVYYAGDSHYVVDDNFIFLPIKPYGKMDIYENKLYYIDEVKDYCISVVDMETNKITSLSVINVSDFKIVGDMILIFYTFDNNKCLTVNDLYTLEEIDLF